MPSLRLECPRLQARSQASKLPNLFFLYREVSMTQAVRRHASVLLANTIAALLLAASAAAQSSSPQSTQATLANETPAKLVPATTGFDYERRDVMIPMRDGVKLHTVILVPKGAKNAAILLTRTPYSATDLTSRAQSAHLGPILYGYDNATEVIVEGGYIRVVQDVRGKHGSEGDYVMNRPIHGPQNPTPVDHATDTYDTIDWLVKNVPESNGKVGIIGISYDGFTPLMALIDPHPALKVAVPMNPMVDGWMGDDWFHNGAFRTINLSYIYEQEATRKSDIDWPSSAYDQYEQILDAGAIGDYAKRLGMEQLGFWQKIIAHPTYDAFWRDQAVDQILAKQPLKVPVMLVHSLWDQEDIYGAIAVYKALAPRDTNHDKLFLVMGPWHHGQEIGEGSALGPIKFGADTALAFRRDILRPFLDHYLKDGGGPPQGLIAPVNAFETGTNTWRKLPSWPAGASGRPGKPTPVYLAAGGKAGFTAPRAGGAAYAEYISDPAKPVPFRSRPILPPSYQGNTAWRQWLVTDQREASGRTDVVSFRSEEHTSELQSPYE